MLKLVHRHSIRVHPLFQALRATSVNLEIVFSLFVFSRSLDRYYNTIKQKHDVKNNNIQTTRSVGCQPRVLLNTIFHATQKNIVQSAHWRCAKPVSITRWRIRTATTTTKQKTKLYVHNYIPQMYCSAKKKKKRRRRRKEQLQCMYIIIYQTCSVVPTNKQKGSFSVCT